MVLQTVLYNLQINIEDANDYCDSNASAPKAYFNDTAVGGWEWIGYLIPHFTAITYPCHD